MKLLHRQPTPLSWADRIERRIAANEKADPNFYKAELVIPESAGYWFYPNLTGYTTVNEARSRARALSNSRFINHSNTRVAW